MTNESNRLLSIRVVRGILGSDDKMRLSDGSLVVDDVLAQLMISFISLDRHVRHNFISTTLVHRYVDGSSNIGPVMHEIDRHVSFSPLFRKSHRHLLEVKASLTPMDLVLVTRHERNGPSIRGVKTLSELEAAVSSFVEKILGLVNGSSIFKEEAIIVTKNLESHTSEETGRLGFQKEILRT